MVSVRASAFLFILPIILIHSLAYGYKASTMGKVRASSNITLTPSCSVSEERCVSDNIYGTDFPYERNDYKFKSYTYEHFQSLDKYITSSMIPSLMASLILADTLELLHLVSLTLISIISIVILL